MKLQHEPLNHGHFSELLQRVQPVQRSFMQVAAIDPAFVDSMKAAGPAVAFIEEHTVLGISGLVDIADTGRSVMWCFYAANIARQFGAIYRMGMRLMHEHPRRRYEAHIDPLFPQGRRLAAVAGFQFEGLMKGFHADGTDRELWAKVTT